MLASKGLLTIVSPCISLGRTIWNAGRPNKNQTRPFTVHFAISKTIFGHLKKLHGCFYDGPSGIKHTYQWIKLKYNRKRSPYGQLSR